MELAAGEGSPFRAEVLTGRRSSPSLLRQPAATAVTPPGGQSRTLPQGLTPGIPSPVSSRDLWYGGPGAERRRRRMRHRLDGR